VLKEIWSDAFSHFFCCLLGKWSEEEVGKLYSRQSCALGLLGVQRQWDVDFYDGLWLCETAVRSGSCGAVGAGGDMLQD